MAFAAHSRMRFADAMRVCEEPRIVSACGTDVYIEVTAVSDKMKNGQAKASVFERLRSFWGGGRTAPPPSPRPAAVPSSPHDEGEDPGDAVERVRQWRSLLMRR